jgi:type IV pilus assembly protein PilW
MYYIGVGADGDSALFRADLTAPSSGSAYSMNAYEIVPDVENMQILYGVDTAGNRAAISYYTAAQVPALCAALYLTTPNQSFNCVTSVSVAFLIASPPGTVSKPATLPSYSLLGTSVSPAAIDTRLRTVYQITVALRNAMP